MHTVVGAHDLGIVLGLDQLRQRAVASRLRLKAHGASRSSTNTTLMFL